MQYGIFGMVDEQSMLKSQVVVHTPDFGELDISFEVQN
jgi:hypothetical protein